jgi:hypothetical protein
MAGRSPTREQLKQAESEQFLAHVKAALDEAHGAAAAAAQSFMKSAKRTPEGHIADYCGGAWVGVYKPSYKLRTALKSLGEIERGDQGAWEISQFSKHADTQSVTAHAEACRAACGVLRERLGDEGEFFARSYVT